MLRIWRASLRLLKPAIWGVTLEAEAILSPDGKTISLNMVPQHTRLKAINKVKLLRNLLPAERSLSNNLKWTH